MMNVNHIETNSKSSKTTERQKNNVAKGRKKVLKNILIMSIFVLFASFIWVVLEGYHLLLSKEMVQQADFLVKPLNPEIGTDIITKSRNKRFYTIEQIDSYYQSLSVLPSSEVAEKQSTDSAQLEDEPLSNGQE
jgi:hypothetical protein